MLSMERPIPETFAKQQFAQSIKLTKKLQDRISHYDIFGKEISGATLARFVDMLHMELSAKEKLADAARPALLASVTDIAGQIASKELIYPWVERFAHNADRIKKGQPVGTFNPDGYLGWSVSEFSDMEYVKKGDEKRIRFRLCVRSGLAYGIYYHREYVANHPSLDVLLYKLGAAGKGSTSSPRELIQLRCWIELRSRRNQLFMQRWTIDEQLKKYNSKIVRERRKPCPFKHKWACAKCPIGYSGKDTNGADVCVTDKCAQACRSQTNQERLNEILARTKLPQLSKGSGLQHQGNTGEPNKDNPTSSKSEAGGVCP
jgi:hypothetical protein